MICTGVFCIIVRKFGYKQRSCLVALLVVDIGLEVDLHSTILSVNLTICLSMEGGRESLFDLQEITQGKPEFRSENWLSVANNEIWQSLISDYCVNNDLCEAWSINQTYDRFVVDYIYKEINYYQYQVVSSTFPIDGEG